MSRRPQWAAAGYELTLADLAKKLAGQAQLRYEAGHTGLGVVVAMPASGVATVWTRDGEDGVFVQAAIRMDNEPPHVQFAKEEWTKAGVVQVRSGQLLVVDPCSLIADDDCKEARSGTEWRNAGYGTSSGWDAKQDKAGDLCQLVFADGQAGLGLRVFTCDDGTYDVMQCADEIRVGVECDYICPSESRDGTKLQWKTLGHCGVDAAEFVITDVSTVLLADKQKKKKKQNQ